MTVTENAAMPAAWYPCPVDPAQLRWWDGQGWTEHTAAPADVPDAPPVDDWPVRSSYDRHGPVGLVPKEPAPAATPWAWVFGVVPLAQAGLVAALAHLNPALALAAAFAVAALGYLVAGLRDAAVLAGRGHRPVGWLWAAIPPAYLALRIARFGRGSIAPAAAWVIAQFAAIAVVAMVVAPLYSQIDTAAEYEGFPPAGASTTPLSADERADLLTPDGMAAKILADLRAEGSVVDDVTCPDVGDLTDTEHVTCRVEMHYADADADVQVTDNYPGVAFVVLRFVYN